MAEQTSARPIRDHSPDAQSKRPAKRKRTPYRSPMRRIASALIKVIALTYVAVVGTMVMLEPRLVYPGAYEPIEQQSAVASSDESAIESVPYKSSDGVVLTGQLVDRPNADNIVLYFHGNGGNASRLGRFANELSSQFNATVMIAEYRGYGPSEEDEITPSEKGVISDCFAARDYLCQRYDRSPEQIILFGQSLGGACAVAVASLGGARVLILDRTFDRMVDLAASRYPILPVRLLMRNRYDSVAKITAYHGPLIQLHGTEDTTIPIQHAESLFHKAPSDKKHWIEMTGLGHNGRIPESAMAELVATFNEYTDAE